MIQHGLWKLFPAVIVLVEALKSGMEWVALTAAAGTGAALILRWLWRTTRRSYRAAHDFIRAAREAIDEISNMPDFRANVIDRFDDGNKRFDHVEERLDRHGALLDVLAEADAERVRDALARHDRRAPVDRRAA